MLSCHSASTSLATTPAATPWTSPHKPPTTHTISHPGQQPPQPLLSQRRQQLPVRTSANYPSGHHNNTGSGSSGIGSIPSAASSNTLASFSVDTVPPPAPPTYDYHDSPPRPAMREITTITTPGIILVPLQVAMDNTLDESLRPI